MTRHSVGHMLAVMESNGSITPKKHDAGLALPGLLAHGWGATIPAPPGAPAAGTPKAGPSPGEFTRAIGAPQAKRLRLPVAIQIGDADRLGRHCIGIELSPAYAQLARARLGGPALAAAA